MAKKRANGEGSITRRESGSWRAQIVINNKRLTFGAKTREECKVWLSKMQEQVGQGLTYEVSRQTIREFIQIWFESAQTTIRQKTAQQYALMIKSRIIPGLGDVRLVELRLDQVDRFYAGLIAKGVGPQMVCYVHRVLHRALQKAVKLGYLSRNPAHGATLPRIHRPEMSVFEESQVSQFLVAVHGTRNEALYQLAIATGMRQGELLGLKWSDIDWKRGLIYVRRQVYRVTGKGFVFEEPKTNSGRRIIFIGQSVLQSLSEHYQRQELEKVYYKDWQDNGLVFPSTAGTPMDQRNLLRDYAAALKLAGLEKIRFHDLRHTAASLMISHDIPINVVSRMLGHSRPSVTLDIYAHVYAGKQEEAARLMAELVSPVVVQLPSDAIPDSRFKDQKRLHPVAPESKDLPVRKAFT